MWRLVEDEYKAFTDEQSQRVARIFHCAPIGLDHVVYLIFKDKQEMDATLQEKVGCKMTYNPQAHDSYSFRRVRMDSLSRDDSFRRDLRGLICDANVHNANKDVCTVVVGYNATSDSR